MFSQVSFNTVVGLFLRGVFLLVAGWLAGKKVLPENSVELWAGTAALIVGAYVWSWVDKYQRKQAQDVLIATAIQMPTTATVADVHTEVAEGYGVTPASVRNILPILIALTLVVPLVGCAKKAPVTKLDAGIYQVLGTVQDVEMTLHTSILPSGQPIIGDDLHGRINQKLTGVLKLGRDFNRVVRDWPVGTPKPATIGLVALQIQQGLQDLLAMLPPSSQIDALRLYLNSALGLIQPFIGA